VYLSNAGVEFSFIGNEAWSASFPLTLHYEKITPGTYTVNTKLLAGNHSCNVSSATFTITNVAYIDGNLDVLDLTYNETCDFGGTISGQLHYWAEDPTTVPGPMNPIPSNLWQPEPSFVAPVGNYMYLEGSAGDPVSQGHNFVLTTNLYLSQRADNTITLQAPSSASAWQALFSAPLPYALIPVGYYGSFNGVANPVLGTLSVKTSLICSQASGWFTVDSIHYTASNGVFQISDLELRFEQVCTKESTPLHGKIHWSSPPTSGVTLTKQMPASVTPIKVTPSSLPSDNACVRAMNGIVTPQGTPGQTFVALDSQPEDNIGRGISFCYTLANAQLPVSISNNAINISVAGDENWTGTFPVTVTNGQIQTGTYQTGSSWWGHSQGCVNDNYNSAITITNATYVNGSLNVLDLNFQMHCENSAGGLNGVIHWWANDPTSWPGPVTAGNQNLWKPNPAFIPPAGNYVYLEGTGGDFISAGLTYLYTPDIMPIAIQQMNRNAIGVLVGDPHFPDWEIDFQGSPASTRIQPGLYKDMKRWPFNNPVTGGLSASGLHRGCNMISGWYMVDKITYSNATSPDQLTSLDVRFEQYCLAFLGASSLTPLHGQIHWVAN
jgi:hypothetical protein